MWFVSHRPPSPKLVGLENCWCFFAYCWGLNTWYLNHPGGVLLVHHSYLKNLRLKVMVSCLSDCLTVSGFWLMFVSFVCDKGKLTFLKLRGASPLWAGGGSISYLKCDLTFRSYFLQLWIICQMWENIVWISFYVLKVDHI